MPLIALDFAVINNKIAAVKIIIDAIAKRYGKAPSPEITQRIFVSWQLVEKNATALPHVKNLLLDYVNEHEKSEATAKEQLYKAINQAIHIGDLIKLQLILDNNPTLDINELHLIYETQGSVGSTLLLTAVVSKHEAIAKFLLTRGADPTIGYGVYPLHAAVSQKDEDMVKLLLECSLMQRKIKEHINLRDVEGKAPIHYAAAIDNYYILDKLLDAGADPNMTVVVKQDKDDAAEVVPLSISIVNKNLPAIAALLQRGACSVQLDSSNQLLQSAIDTDDPNVVRTLLKCTKLNAIAGYLNAAFIDGMPALYYTVCTNNKEMVECLLDLGADIERPLEIQESASILSDIKSQPKEGQSKKKLIFIVRPIHCAIGIGSLEMTKLLKLKGASLNATLPAEKDILFAALQSNNVEIVELVLQFDVEPTFRFRVVQNSLDDEIIYMPNDYRIIQLLLHHPKFNPSHNITKAGATPLHIACQKKDFDQIKLFVEAGFDLLSTPAKSSPFVLALSNCHDKSFLVNLFDLLREKGVLEKALNMPITHDCYPLQLIYLFSRKLVRYCIHCGANPDIPCPDAASQTIAEKLGIREPHQQEKSQNPEMAEQLTEFAKQVTISGRRFLLNNGYSEQEISTMQATHGAKATKSSAKFWKPHTKQRTNVAINETNTRTKPQSSLRRS